MGDAGDERPYEMLAQRVSVIAKPLADKKLTKKLYKGVKKAHKAKALSRGVKEVVKALKKKKSGLCIIAGVISPIPVMCEDVKIPYCYVPSKEDLGMAGQTKRPTSVVLIRTEKGLDVEGLDELMEEVKALPVPH